MPEPPNLHVKPLNVSVIGYGAKTSTPQLRVGKSSLIKRFMNPTAYTEDHLSIISNSDYYSSVISTHSWLYWGTREVQSGKKCFRLRLIEQTEFFDDHLYGSYSKVAYIDRCLKKSIKVDGPKVAYISKDQVGHEWKYDRQLLELGEHRIDVFVVVADVTLTGDAADCQEEFLSKALSGIKNMKIPVVIVYAKCDSARDENNIKKLENVLRPLLKSHGKLRFCRVETSARLNVNVDSVFVSAASLCENNDMNGKVISYPDSKPPPVPRVGEKENVHLRDPTPPGEIPSFYMSTSIEIKPRPSRRVEKRHSLPYDLPMDTPSLQASLNSQEISNFSSHSTSMREPVRLPSSVPTNGVCALRTSYQPELLGASGVGQPSLLQGAMPLPPPARSVVMKVSPTSHPPSFNLQSTQYLMLLHLYGPGASAFSSVIHSQLCDHCFELADGHLVRLWVFVEGRQGGRTNNILRPSPSAPSAFSTPSPSGNSSSENQDKNKGKLRLDLWVSGPTASASFQSDDLPSLLNGFVFLCRQEGAPLDAQVEGEPVSRFGRFFTKTKGVGQPIFFINTCYHEPNLLRVLFFYCKNLEAFTKTVNRTITTPPVIFLSGARIDMDAITSVCLPEPEDRSSIDKPPTLEAFRAVPRVAVGIDYSLVPQNTQQPIVVFTTVPQAQELLVQFPDVRFCAPGRVRFAAIHFHTQQWPRFCAELTSQMETLMAAADESLRLQIVHPQAPPQDSRRIIVLVALMAADATRTRQLVQGLAAQRGCLLWQPSFSGLSNQQDAQGEEEDDEEDEEDMEKLPDSQAPRASLAFIHVQSEFQDEFGWYRQVLLADMSSWRAGTAQSFSFVSVSQERACTRRNRCEECRGPGQLPGPNSHIYSPIMLPRFELYDAGNAPHSLHPLPPRPTRFPPQAQSAGNQRASCCAQRRAGIGDDEYADASIRFTPRPGHNRVPLPRRPDEDEISEQYDDLRNMSNGLMGPPPQPPRMRPSHPHPGQSSSSSIGSLTTSSVVVHGRTTSFIGPPQPSLFSHINRSQSDNQPGPSTRPLMAGRDSGVVTHTFTPLVFPNYTGSSFSAASMSESVASRQVTLPQLPQASHEATEATAEDIYEDITDDPEPVSPADPSDSLRIYEELAEINGFEPYPKPCSRRGRQSGQAYSPTNSGILPQRPTIYAGSQASPLRHGSNRNWAPSNGFAAHTRAIDEVFSVALSRLDIEPYASVSDATTLAPAQGHSPYYDRSPLGCRHRAPAPVDSRKKPSDKPRTEGADQPQAAADYPGEAGPSQPREKTKKKKKNSLFGNFGKKVSNLKGLIMHKHKSSKRDDPSEDDNDEGHSEGGDP